MKTKFFITTLLFLIGGLCLKAQTNDTDTQKAIATLKEFYKVIYDDNSWKEEQFLKYVSKELFNKVFFLPLAKIIHQNMTLLYKHKTMKQKLLIAV